MSALPCRVSVLALRLFGLLAAPVRINIRRRDYIPARLALPVSVYKRPVFAYFPPFWRPFGVAVVSSAGAVSLRPFGWCRCAYKVAAPVWPCFRPCFVAKGHRASLAAVAVSSDLHPVRYFPHQSQRDKIPPHGRAVCFPALRPCWWCLVAIAPRPLLAALLSRWRRINIRQYSNAATRWRGDCAPAVLTLSVCQKTCAAGWRPLHRARRVAVSLRGVICARAGYRAPPLV